MIAEDLYLAQPEIDSGIARRPCPRCAWPLVIRIPPREELSRPSVALELRLDDLSAGERALFDAVHEHFPRGAPRDTIEDAAGIVSESALHMLIWRLRGKLLKYDWHLIASGRTLRLVGPDKP